MNLAKQRDTSHHSEIKSVSVHQQCNIRKRKSETNPIYCSNKKSKVPRNKLNQGGKTPVTQKTTEHWGKKLQNIQINGSIYLVHGLEELTSLRSPYYPKKSIDPAY